MWENTVLEKCRREKIYVTLFLVSGFQMHGTIVGYDSAVVCLETNGQMQMIYKHAISTINY